MILPEERFFTGKRQIPPKPSEEFTTGEKKVTTEHSQSHLGSNLLPVETAISPDRPDSGPRSVSTSLGRDLVPVADPDVRQTKRMIIQSWSDSSPPVRAHVTTSPHDDNNGAA